MFAAILESEVTVVELDRVTLLTKLQLHKRLEKQ